VHGTARARSHQLNARRWETARAASPKNKKKKQCASATVLCCCMQSLFAVRSAPSSELGA
jgi:hypothetical protein